MPSVNTKLIYSSASVLPSLKDDNALYITDSKTTSLLKQSKNYSPSIPHIELDAGEEYKTHISIEKILEKAIGCGINRDGKFVGVGGGVVLDMTGFASSIYMRGVEAIYIPTTLLAMVDAAIGGKTGIDFNGFKNIVGTFYLPKEVYICSDYLSSLDDVQYRSGLAEMLKISLINRPSLYHTIMQNATKIKTKMSFESSISLNMSSNSQGSFPFLELIKDAIEGKMEIVKSDFDEKGARVYLNLGHTFAHALEAAMGFSGITHGEAVAWGISRSLSLGVLLGKTEERYREEVSNLLVSLGYCTEAIPPHLKNKLGQKAMCEGGIDALRDNALVTSDVQNKNAIANLLIEKMRYDKKNKSKMIRLVLQKKLGCTFTEEVDESYVREVLV